MIGGQTWREVRRRGGRTQADVAAAVGIPAIVVSAYAGVADPACSGVARLVDELGYRIEFVPRLDPAVQAHKLADVLNLAEALPSGHAAWSGSRPSGSSRRPPGCDQPTSRQKRKRDTDRSVSLECVSPVQGHKLLARPRDSNSQPFWSVVAGSSSVSVLAEAKF